jgi:hypothetical protein
MMDGISILDKASAPFVAGVYALLSLTDMVFSSLAFALGVPEANPVMAWLCSHGFFLPAKLLLTAAAAGLILWLYPKRQARSVAWLGVATMAGVVVYHIWGLRTL